MSVAQQALKDVGIPVEVYYASEIDEYAIAVTQSNFPNTKQLGDIVDLVSEEGLSVGIRGKGFLESVDNIDLLIGGSPCQDLSIAKKNREGLSGARSGLFWKYVYMRNYIKPKYFILENVASMPKEAKEIISEALGVQPIMINASLVSAQNRKRLFWVGKWNGEKYEQVEMSQPEDRDILLKDILESGDSDRLKSYCIDANYWKGTSLEHYLKKGVRQIVMLTETRTEEAKQIRKENMKNGIDYSPRRAKELIPRKDEKANTITTGQTKESLILIPENNAYDYYNRRVVPNEKAKVLGTNPQSTTAVAGQLVNQNMQIRKLTPTECLRLQSMPDDYFDKAIYKNKPITNTQKYKMCGNAFNKEVIVHILKHLV